MSPLDRTIPLVQGQQRFAIANQLHFDMSRTLKKLFEKYRRLTEHPLG